MCGKKKSFAAIASKISMLTNLFHNAIQLDTTSSKFAKF